MDKSVRWAIGAALAAALLPVTSPARACSLVSCIDRGIEVQRNFTVAVKHEGKPLAGVRFEIRAFSGERVIASAETGSDGKATIANLPPGDYWLRADLLGIGAAYHCFHVAHHSSSAAKRRLKYAWGESALSMGRVEGKLVDVERGSGGTSLWNLVHPVKLPIIGATLRLQNAITNEIFGTKSDEHGEFAFGVIPDGTYVLHIEGATTDLRYDATDLLISTSGRSTRHLVVFTRQAPGATSCGDSWVASWD